MSVIVASLNPQRSNACVFSEEPSLRLKRMIKAELRPVDSHSATPPPCRDGVSAKKMAQCAQPIVPVVVYSRAVGARSTDRYVNLFVLGTMPSLQRCQPDDFLNNADICFCILPITATYCLVFDANSVMTTNKL